MSVFKQDGKVLALLHESKMTNCGANNCSTAKKAYTGHVQAALIPEVDFLPLCEEIEDCLKRQKEAYRGKVKILTMGQVREIAASCDICDLCMTCAGKHYTYSRDFDKTFPPGQEKCFAFLEKSGRKKRDKPCELCPEHDELLRKTRGSTARARSVESKLRTELQQLYARRKLLFDTHDVSIKVFLD